MITRAFCATPSKEQATCPSIPIGARCAAAISDRRGVFLLVAAARHEAEALRAAAAARVAEARAALAVVGAAHVVASQGAAAEPGAVVRAEVAPAGSAASVDRTEKADSVGSGDEPERCSDAASGSASCCLAACYRERLQAAECCLAGHCDSAASVRYSHHRRADDSGTLAAWPQDCAEPVRAEHCLDQRGLCARCCSDCRFGYSECWLVNYSACCLGGRHRFEDVPAGCFPAGRRSA